MQERATYIYFVRSYRSRSEVWNDKTVRLVGEPESRILQNDREIAPERPTAEFLYTGSLNSA